LNNVPPEGFAMPRKTVDKLTTKHLEERRIYEAERKRLSRSIKNGTFDFSDVLEFLEDDPNPIQSLKDLYFYAQEQLDLKDYPAPSSEAELILLINLARKSKDIEAIETLEKMQKFVEVAKVIQKDNADSGSASLGSSREN